MKDKIILLLLVVSWAAPAWSYEETVTHRAMTRRAVMISQLMAKDSDLPQALGLYPLTEWSRFPFGDDKLGPRDPATIFEQGAIREDAMPLSLNHFYDPVNNKPLNFGGLDVPLANRSPDWILEDKGEYLFQSDSYRDARSELYKAFTTPGPKSARDIHWGAVFRSLGHVVHHIQDMAQPQHVRNDNHLNLIKIDFFPFSPSRYEQYTHDIHAQVADIIEGTQSAAFPGSPFFKIPRDFWWNENLTGLAQYTNRSFLSQGTNFSSDSLGKVVTTKYAKPTPGLPTDYTLAQLFGGEEAVPELLKVLCAGGSSTWPPGGPGLPAPDCTMTMYSAEGVTKASTLSIFDQDLEKGDLPVVPRHLFAVNRFNFGEVHQQVLPLAVSYSAGLINYFFRGRLQITPPDQGHGAYAVTDHASGNGFSSIKATVKNVTHGEAMQDGRVVAMVKFHRNQCYKPDLTGEFMRDSSNVLVYPKCDPGQTYRTSEEFIIQSEEQPLSLSSGAEKELTFSFPSPIPFGATDVYLQVVVRGKLGDEADAIAFGTADISEPTYVSFSNATDVLELPLEPTGTGFYYVEDTIADQNIETKPYSIADSNKDGHYATPPDWDVREVDCKMTAYLDGPGGTYTPIAGIDSLPAGRFSRLALLLKPGTFTLYLFLQGTGTFTESMKASTNQLNWYEDENAYGYNVSSLSGFREQTRHWNHLVIYRSLGARELDVGKMPVSRAENAAEPVAAKLY